MLDFTLHAVALGVVPWRSVLMATRHRPLRSILVNQCRHSRVVLTELDNVAINDVLPLKAARHNAIANLKCLGASDTRDLTSVVTFTFSMRRHQTLPNGKKYMALVQAE